MSKTLLMIMMEKPDGVSEEEFNRLYNESHIPALLSVPGVHGAKRYRLNGVDGDLDVPTYLALYEGRLRRNEVFGSLADRHPHRRMGGQGPTAAREAPGHHPRSHRLSASPRCPGAGAAHGRRKPRHEAKQARNRSSGPLDTIGVICY